MSKISTKLKLLIENLRLTIQELSLSEPTVIDIPFNDSIKSCVKISLPPSFSLYLIPSDLFPMAPPVALMNWGNGAQGTYLPFDWEWDDTIDIGNKIFISISKYIDGSPPYRVSWGVDIKNPITNKADIGKKSSWKKFLISSSKCIPSSVEAAKHRIETDLVDALASSSVTLIGLGSVGSYMAEQFIRSGLGSITLIDPDIVEVSNISRTTYTLQDINRKKTEALESKLRFINPDTLITCLPSTLQSIGGVALNEIIEQSTIVVAATDDPNAQSLINSCTFYSSIPSVFVGLYKGAKGGEVATTIPSVTPCLQCMTGLRRNIDLGESQISRKMNYGTNRLTGEIALNSDIQHVSSAALKISYSLIASLKGVESSVSNFIPNAISQEKHFLTMGMEADYWFYPEIFKNTAGQYAFQSVWLTASNLDECHICGLDAENTESPYQYIKSIPSQNSIREQLQNDTQD